MTCGQLSRENHHRRWNLVNVKKTASWWPRERYKPLKKALEVLP